MNLDVRLPIGLMFTIFGVALAGFGLTSDPAIYAAFTRDQCEFLVGTRVAGLRTRYAGACTWAERERRAGRCWILAAAAILRGRRTSLSGLPKRIVTDSTSTP